MVRVTLWPQLLLVVLLLRQSAAVSDQCSQLQEEMSRLRRHIPSCSELQDIIFRLERDLLSMSEMKGKNKLPAGKCDVCRSLLDAAKSGDVESVKRLVKCDMNDNCTGDDDKYRNTPLTYAAIKGHVKVVRVLLEGGADVDRANAYGSTALHYAAYKGYLDVCRLLLDLGAKMDLLNGRQDTPLHYAAREGHLSVVKLLVERGADVSVKNGDGQTASDWARLYQLKDVADWLDNVRRG